MARCWDVGWHELAQATAVSTADASGVPTARDVQGLSVTLGPVPGAATDRLLYLLHLDSKGHQCPAGVLPVTWLHILLPQSRISMR